MLYSYENIIMSMTNLSIYTFIHVNLIVSFKYAHEHEYPQMVTDALIEELKIVI